MTLVALGLAIACLLLCCLTFVCVLKIVNLEQRVAWLEGQGAVEEVSSQPEVVDVPDIMKAGATQPPGRA